MEQKLQHQIPQPVQAEKLRRHLEKGERVLTKLLPEGLPSVSGEEAERFIAKHFPVLKWDAPPSIPDILSIYFLCAPTHEIKPDQAFLQLMRKWLLPEKELHVAGFDSVYFYKRAFSTRLFFAAEMQIVVEQDRDLSEVIDNLPLLSHELSLCLSSAQYTQLLLDTKALSLDQQSTQIQGYLRKLFARASDHFDRDLFREMSLFLAVSQPNFRQIRSPRHLTRIIASHYLMRRRLLHHLSVSPQQRHLELRCIRSKLQFPFGAKPILGIVIAIAFSGRYEMFDDKNVMDAVQAVVPDAKMVKGSYYFFRANHDPVKYLYLELEKKDRTLFQREEIAALQRGLGTNLKKRVETLIPSVFMTRNEEEVMRNIFLLSQELCSPSDIPQVMIHFEKQEAEELFFTIILVRAEKKGDQTLGKAFADCPGQFRFLADRVQRVGHVRKKISKTAYVFHLCLPKEKAILRADFSVNFYLARQKVVSILTAALGEVRDYNGGMLLKQGELLSQLKREFAGIAQDDLELLENFFFSLSPIEAQATTALSVLKTLFQLVLEAASEKLLRRDSYFHKCLRKRNRAFGILRTKDAIADGILSEEIGQLEGSRSFIKVQVFHLGTHFRGYIYEMSRDTQYGDFQARIARGINRWLDKLRSQQELRLSFDSLPRSLDPRLGGDDYSTTLMKMLFEGLTRLGRDSKPDLALAQSVDVSPDRKRYTFKLRPTMWSDGTPLTAQDFEYAWKRVLSPAFYTPFAYFFYPIKHARAAKNGEADISEVGITVPDARTIIVDLESPTPEFLEQTAHALYSPIHRKHDQLHPNWAQDFGDGYICNGFMKLEKSLENGGYALTQNPFYWDSASVKLGRIVVIRNNAETALEMFRNGAIDWLGHPIRPWEACFAENDGKKRQTKALGVHWCVFNTQRHPFDCLKMRRAFSLAIDRSEMLPEQSGILGAATSPLPLIHATVQDEMHICGNQELAAELFEQALQELGLTRGGFAAISLLVAAGSPTRRLVAQRLIAQWEKVLGVHCRLEILPFHHLFPKMVEGSFQLGTINWTAWINDPFYTLNAFQYRSNRVNFSKWEHEEYKSYLSRAHRAIIPGDRTHYLKKAEQLLIRECPVLPIYREQYVFMHNEQLVDVLCSDTGHVDFKWSSISSL